MAEGAGFEPAIRFITVYTLSRRAPSTARPPLRRASRGRRRRGAPAGSAARDTSRSQRRFAIGCAGAEASIGCQPKLHVPTGAAPFADGLSPPRLGARLHRRRAPRLRPDRLAARGAAAPPRAGRAALPARPLVPQPDAGGDPAL